MMWLQLTQQAQQQAQIAQQQRVATQNAVSAIQSNVSSDTFSLLRQFGGRAAQAVAALAGGTSPGGPQLTTPMSQAGNGFDAALVTQRGMPTMPGLKYGAAA